MGGDGGSFVKRRDCIIVTKKEKERPADPRDMNIDLWTQCAIGQTRLQRPVAMCALGKLYSMENVAAKLKDKNDFHAFKHLTSLKSLLRCNFTLDTEKRKGAADEERPYFVCPVTGLPGNGTFKFYRITSCKCVVSERALKNLPGNDCPSCSKPYGRYLSGEEEKDLNAMRDAAGDPLLFHKEMRPYLPVNPPKEVQDQLHVELEHRKRHAKRLRKEAKAAKAKLLKNAPEEVRAAAAQLKVERRKRKKEEKAAIADLKARKGKSSILLSHGNQMAIKEMKEQQEHKRAKSSAYNKLFLTQEQIDEQRNFSSTKAFLPGFAL